jgi:hypothetical protein
VTSAPSKTGVEVRHWKIARVDAGVLVVDHDEWLTGGTVRLVGLNKRFAATG